MGTLRKNCKTPGCPNLHRNASGYCDDCQAKYEASHPGKESRQAWGYDRKWRTFARHYLEEHPVCAICGAPATCVDHRDLPADVMMEAFGEFDYNEVHYQALCASCNARKGATVDRRIRDAFHADLERWNLRGKEKNR